MAGLLQKLENNEAILLMYLAGELPAEDCAEVERMLDGDASLRRMLRELRALQGTACAALERLDRMESRPGRDEQSVRRVMRDLRRRQMEPREVPASVDQDLAAKPWRWPWWANVAAAAAVVVVGIGLWGLGLFDRPVGPYNPTVGLSDSAGEQLVVDLERSFTPPNARLEEADRHMEAIRGEEDWLLSMR